MWPVSNAVWICLVTLGICQYSQAAKLRCYNGALTNYKTFPLEDPLSLWRSSCLDHSLPTIFYAFGYKGRVYGNATTAVLKAYLVQKKRNVILLDWEQEASVGLNIYSSYMLSAVPNAKRVGEELGEALVKLAKYGLNMKQVHLLGHSLGAHLMGYAGRRARSDGYVVSRITGLDPASALFEPSSWVPAVFQPFIENYKGLDRTSATFVDIIHTSPGGYGLRKSAGTVDIWPNYAGDGVKQPGCPEGNFQMFSAENLCSHDRSWQFLVESLSDPTAFVAASATSFDRWAARDFNGSDTIFLGELTNRKARGNYFLTTNEKKPFGKGNEGVMPDSNQIRRRRTPKGILSRFIS